MSAVPGVSDDGRSLTFTAPGVGADGVLAVYLYAPQVPQEESPRPCLHPVFTLGGTAVTGFRPPDHRWHHGLSLALPHVGASNLWGGPTWVRERGQYVPMPVNGSMRHVAFDAVGGGEVVERLSWHDHGGRQIATERRTLGVAVAKDCWRLSWRSAITHDAPTALTFGSPATRGRSGAGYAGIFWRAPGAFRSGRVYADGARQARSADDLLGVRSRFMAFTGGSGAAAATVIMIDDGEAERPTQWFARSVEYPGFGPAPFFDEELALAPGRSLDLACRVVVVDGDDGWRDLLTR